MSLYRTSSRIAVGLLVLLAGSAVYGQGLAGMQLFAPADVSSYGRGPQPNEGFFFSYDILYWTISQPRVSTVGKEGLTRTTYRVIPEGESPDDYVVIQHNTLDTGQLGADFTLGNRFEFGRITNNQGWMVSIYQMQDLGQSSITSNVDVVFDEAAFGPLSLYILDGYVQDTSLIGALPVTFSNVLIENSVSTWGIEADYVGRSEELHHGGYFEWFIGPRYIEFDDTFLVNAVGGVLANSNWTTEAQNHIIGGQIGGRFFKKRGRWMLSTEGRFLAGLNCQNIRQYGLLGSQLDPPGGLGEPLVMGPTEIYHSEFIRQWTPGAELRVEARYQITRSVTFRAGWTGIWLNNVARASEMIDYTLDPNNNYMGIVRGMNNDNVFINGVTIGIDINR
jgi:hypothetical protein